RCLATSDAHDANITGTHALSHQISRTKAQSVARAKPHYRRVRSHFRRSGSVCPRVCDFNMDCAGDHDVLGHPRYPAPPHPGPAESTTKNHCPPVGVTTTE